MILVSACLVGIKCRYDGTNAFCNELMDFLKDKNYLPVCPEQLGGLPTPRVPAVIVGGDGFDVQKLKARVINEAQKDVTFNFLQGAKKTLELAKLFMVEKCYLKEKSPSCGVKWVYKKEGLSCGFGVTAALLFKNGYEIIGV
ncbi:MAG: DUF523 domain-containing protein [Candidatus Desulfofervidus sp.]|nr:DUF523 domain-containing protein [Candidatus Desulfofervidus sp.]